MRETLVNYGCGYAAMESTSIYWMPVWNILQHDLELKLVNPYFIKQLPGRKSDVKDAQWIAQCLQKDLIKGSYVPESTVRQAKFSRAKRCTATGICEKYLFSAVGRQGCRAKIFWGKNTASSPKE